jgi:hypothetical protein
MNSVPPRLSPFSTRGLAVFLALAAAATGALVYFVNPSVYHVYPVCQFHELTGLNCPGCGGTRALYALLHGRFAAAFHDNALFVASLPVLAVRGGWFALNRWRGRPNGPFFPLRCLIPLVVVTLAFGVLRNLPAFAFLSP